VCAVGVRRWIHHAQLELVPVIVPQAADPDAIVKPPAGAIVARMAEDVNDFIRKPDRPRLAVLTFDDGPYPVETPALLAQLRALHVPADFFLIGDDATAQPGISRRMTGAGIEVGNHSLTHPEMPSLSYDLQRSEVVSGENAVGGETGQSIRYFRPPHGNYDASTLRAASTSGETVALWDIDPGDWRTLSADEIVSLVTAQARAPAVIILHNGKLATVEALPRIVDAFRAAGFQFVTLSELQRRVPIDIINDPVKVQL
jgi:peptidoglycan/xylan/chitin deacetylase (PgdA/CDA1 family)